MPIQAASSISAWVKPFFSGVFQVHLQAGLAPQRHRQSNGHRLLRVGVQSHAAQLAALRNCLNVALTWSISCSPAAPAGSKPPPRARLLHRL